MFHGLLWEALIHCFVLLKIHKNGKIVADIVAGLQIVSSRDGGVGLGERNLCWDHCCDVERINWSTKIHSWRQKECFILRFDGFLEFRLQSGQLIVVFVAHKAWVVCTHTGDVSHANPTLVWLRSRLQWCFKPSYLPNQFEDMSVKGDDDSLMEILEDFRSTISMVGLCQHKSEKRHEFPEYFAGVERLLPTIFRKLINQPTIWWCFEQKQNFSSSQDASIVCHFLREQRDQMISNIFQYILIYIYIMHNKSMCGVFLQIQHSIQEICRQNDVYCMLLFIVCYCLLYVMACCHWKLCVFGALYFQLGIFFHRITFMLLIAITWTPRWSWMPMGWVESTVENSLKLTIFAPENGWLEYFLVSLK